MGIGTFVRETSPQDRPRAGGFDMPLLVIVVALIVFGLVMLYSASWDFSRAAYNGDAMYMFNRQLMWLGLGTVAALILAFIDYHRWRQFIVPA
ncbi:MAG TPA: FtsW/RodA/SpoVE family cell cycle protein, partial [Anaerolineales bacterium]|nr:FtsW/RodA/SpoVE family cell cycle protein [Anaerolineales bacterium]